MATTTVKNTASAWGSSSFSSSSGFKVGRTSANVYYKGRITFPALEAGKKIVSAQFEMYRTDSYSSHTLKLGTSKTNSFSPTLDWSANYSYSSGTGYKKVDITAAASALETYTSGSWYLYVQHGSGSNSYSEFSGGASAFSLYIEYEDSAYVYYRNGSSWVKCAVYYRNGSQWVQCTPYYRNGSTWVKV